MKKMLLLMMMLFFHDDDADDEGEYYEDCDKMLMTMTKSMETRRIRE